MAISSKTAKHSRTSISFSSLFLTMESLSQESEGLSSGLGAVLWEYDSTGAESAEWPGPWK